MDTYYDNKVIKYFMVASVFWGLASMLVGLILAGQLYWPELNFDSPYFHFGRLRPVHTNGIIYGFVVNFLMGTSLYIVQRTGKVPLFNKSLSWLVFWGWELILVLALITLPLGFTTAKEYAELEWPIDILIAIIWVMYTILFFATLAKRKEKHIFVSNWFFAAFMLVIAFIFVVNNLAIPVELWKSYPIYSGVNDAMIQWWWGHNAVGFLLTAGLIGMNYYFISKVSERPIYSYRLSILHFWGLVGFYTWAGTHHLIYSSVPDWVQNLGIVMSIILWLPSWAGAYNSMMTLLSNREKLKTDYIMKFFLSAVFFYALATLEGPLLAIRWFNMLAHNTDWVIGHVHSGALGWVALSAIAVFYYFIPRLFSCEGIWSLRLLKYHFWLAHIGIVLYTVALWFSGIGQGAMWLSQQQDASLSYSFIETMQYTAPWMLMRFIGGGLFLLGMLLMAYNLIMTVFSAPKTDSQILPANDGECVNV